MVDDLLGDMGAALTRWTMGGSAPVPPAWRDAVADSDLALLALSGHFLGTMVVAEPPGPLVDRPDLPVLALPTLAEAPRLLARRLLLAADARQRQDLLGFVAARGWSVHPADWLPAANDDAVPDVYAPWRDWADGGTPAHGDEGLTAANWDQHWPAARVAALTELRRRDPAAARDLLAARLAGETGDRRLRLLATLAIGLSEADRPLLDSLAGDRAPRVKAMAAGFRARLGRGDGEANAEDTAELAGFFEFQMRGLLRRTRVIVPRPTKTAAQAGRRDTLAAAADFAALAVALGTDAPGLAAAWSWGVDDRADRSIAAMAERSAGDAVLGVLIDGFIPRFTAAVGASLDLVQILGPRLAPAQRMQLAGIALAARDGDFGNVLAIAGPCGSIDRAFDSAAGKAVLAVLSQPGDARRPGDASGELLALGLLASPAAAAAAMARLTAAGLLAADPRLDMLRLNTLLEPRGIP